MFQGPGTTGTRPNRRFGVLRWDEYGMTAKKKRKVLQNDTLHRRSFRVQGPREHVQIDDFVFCDGMNMT